MTLMTYSWISNCK